MQITRETDYAIRCVYYLAGRTEGVTMIEEISSGMSIPRSFLAKILQKLTKADIVRSRRGIKGGFELARAPKLISLLDVIEAIEGTVAMNVCAVDRKKCSFSGRCAVHPVWVEVRTLVEKALASKNFEALRRKKACPAGPDIMNSRLLKGA